MTSYHDPRPVMIRLSHA